MYVCVKGDPGSSSCSIVGLDILGTRHPKLFTHILERMGFSLNCSNVGITAFSWRLLFELVSVAQLLYNYGILTSYVRLLYFSPRTREEGDIWTENYTCT